MDDKRVINIEVPVSLYERAKDQANNECTSMATIVRRAIDEYLRGKFGTTARPEARTAGPFRPPAAEVTS